MNSFFEKKIIHFVNLETHLRLGYGGFILESFIWLSMDHSKDNF